MLFRIHCVLYPCCFCKLLGLCFYAYFVGFMVGTLLNAAFYAMLKSVLLSKCFAFCFMYCHSCALVELFLDALLSVLCIGWVLGIQVSCFVLVNLYVQVFIPSVNKHCDHYLVVITWLIKPWFESSLHLCLITLSLFHMHFMLFCIQWSWCIVVFPEFHVLLIQVLHSFWS